MIRILLFVHMLASCDHAQLKLRKKYLLDEIMQGGSVFDGAKAGPRSWYERANQPAGSGGQSCPTCG